MSKKIMLNLLSKNSVEIVEKHLIYKFIQINRVDYLKSPLLSNFLNDFKVDNLIIEAINQIGLKTVKDLEKSLEYLIPESDRKSKGIFFTPETIVNYIVNEVEPKESDTCLDPACGNGAFLIGLIEYFKNMYQKSIKKTVRENIYGWDILSQNIERTKIVIAIYGLLNNEIIDGKDFNLSVRDSLNSIEAPRFDIIVGNPPYIKYQDIDENNRVLMTKKWETTQKGNFNIYFPFFELGYKLLKDTGKLGYITLNSFISSLAGKPLREFFSKNRAIHKLIDFKDQKVFGVSTYTAITFLDKNNNDYLFYSRYDNHQSYEDVLKENIFSKNMYSNLDVKKWRFFKDNEYQTIKRIENIGTPLKELFNISASIATLKDEVYFINGKTLSNGFYTKVTDKRTFQIEEEIVKPVYKISELKSENDIVKNSRFIIFPYYEKNGNYIPIQEIEFKQKYPECYKYLLSEKDILLARDKGKKDFNPFYVWGRNQGLTNKGIKLLTPTFSYKPRFFISKEEDSYFTNGYGIFFKDYENSLFNGECKLSNPENIELLKKILNSKVMELYIKLTSTSIQGSSYCYQKNFIESFSIPYFSDSELNKLKYLNTEKLEDFLFKKYNLKTSI